MLIRTIKTRTLVPPKDDLLGVISISIKSLKEKSVIVITSKVISIWQGQCISINEAPHKDELIKAESDLYLPREVAPEALVMHTIKNNIFIPSAGIDESNAKGCYILWPENPRKTARELWLWLKNKYKVKNLGVIISDSHTIPLRRGTMGISLAHFGFNPLRNYVGKEDLFGRKLKMSQTDMADGLAAAAVLMMGEGKECTPIAVIEDVPGIEFISDPRRAARLLSIFEIKTKEDLYYPLFRGVRWRKGKNGYRIKTKK